MHKERKANGLEKGDVDACTVRLTKRNHGMQVLIYKRCYKGTFPVPLSTLVAQDPNLASPYAESVSQQWWYK